MGRDSDRALGGLEPISSRAIRKTSYDIPMRDWRDASTNPNTDECSTYQHGRDRSGRDRAVMLVSRDGPHPCHCHREGTNSHQRCMPYEPKTSSREGQCTSHHSTTKARRNMKARRSRTVQFGAMVPSIYQHHHQRWLSSAPNLDDPIFISGAYQ